MTYLRSMYLVQHEMNVQCDSTRKTKYVIGVDSVAIAHHMYVACAITLEKSHRRTRGLAKLLHRCGAEYVFRDGLQGWGCVAGGWRSEIWARIVKMPKNASPSEYANGVLGS